MHQIMKGLIGVLVLSLLFLMTMFLSANSGLAMDMESGHDMFSHHQHIMLNHALGMTLEGYNLVMLGDMGMAKGVDDISVDHGRMMLKNARALFNDIMSGKNMMNMHMGGTTPESDAMMKYTHQLAEAQLQVLALLDDMPAINK